MKKGIIICLLMMLCFMFSSCIKIYLPESTPAPTETVSPEPEPTAEEPAPTPEPSAELSPEPTTSPEPEAIDLTAIRPGSYVPLSPEVDNRFVLADWHIDGFMYNCDKSGLLLTYGTYESTRSEVWGATGDTHEYYTYHFGELEFVNGKFAGAKIYTNAVEGPRGIRVGDRVDDVIKMFHTGYEKQTEDQVIFYRQNPDRPNWTSLPPYGMMTDYTKLMLTYGWYDSSAYDMHLTLDELEEYIIYSNVLTFSMYINGEGIVKEFYLHSGADAE